MNGLSRLLILLQDKLVSGYKILNYIKTSFEISNGVVIAIYFLAHKITTINWPIYKI